MYRIIGWQSKCRLKAGSKPNVPEDVIKFELPASFTVLEVLRRFSDAPFLLLLDSASRIRARDARYTFLTADPVRTLRLECVFHGDRPFQQLREWQRQLPVTEEASLPPFFGGIAGLMSYELGEAFEVLPRPGVDDFKTPALVAGLFDWCICWDHIRKSVTGYVVKLHPDLEAIDSTAVPEPQQRIEWIRSRLSDQKTITAATIGSAQAISISNSETDVPALESQTERSILTVPARSFSILSEATHHQIQPGVFSSFTAERYIAAVERVVDYIRAGDIFQANLSQRLTGKWQGSAVDLYQRIRNLNPAPFCALMTQPDFAVVSASPERFLKVTRGRFVETRPIKGTRRRQKSPIADLFTTDQLTSSQKDRAENVMIVDLLRNDLSRCCRPGSVKVSGLCEVELFETVQHLVSTVVGELCTDKNVWDLCAACFPGGSITGAPKIRAMQIIAELEPTVRGAYCGGLFFCGPQGDFDSSILIRTFTLKDGWLQFPVGGGIVADSDSADEYRETLHKASGMLRVLAGH